MLRTSLPIFEKQRERALILRNESCHERRNRLKKIEQWILSNREQLYDALFNDLRKAHLETDITEVFTVMLEVREAIRNLKDWMEEEVVSTPITFAGTSAYHHYEPRGVCLIISPWNYPFYLAISPVISALAAGNTFILKPSEYTPYTSSLIKSMVDELFDDDLGYVVEGDGKVAEQLTSLPFDHIFFTGSQETGKLVMKAASENLVPVTLELGGKSPTIVDETADLKDAAEKVAWGKWLNAGQTCVAPDYLFVNEKIYDQFMNLLKRAIQRIYPESDYSAIIHKRHFERLTKMVAQSVKQGATTFVVKKSAADMKINPVILEDVKEDMAVMQEEIFGPILPVLKYEDLDHVIDFINDRSKPLALYLFSRSSSNKNQIIMNTSSGAMAINETVFQIAHPKLAFGGVNHSGIGESHGREGFKTFSNKKSIMIQRIGFTMPKLLYPPYNKWRQWLMDVVIKYLS